MKKTVLLLFSLILLLSGCVTRDTEQQSEISQYYSMIYKIGYDAFQPIAEEHLNEGDRVLIVNTGLGFRGIGGRFEYEQDMDLEPFNYDYYIEDHPFFIEYLENGYINSFLQNGGVGFERMNLAGYIDDYANYLRNEKLIFNTSILDYKWWSEIGEKFGVSKVLVYSVHNVVDKESDYVGVQLELKFIDVAGNGKILYDSIRNVVSVDFPESELTLMPRMHMEIPEKEIELFDERLNEMLALEGLDSLDAILVKNDDISFLGTYPITVEDFIMEKEITRKLTGLENLDLLEKLFKRRYKTSFQLIHAVNNIHPLRGGEYSAFESYYGTRYMLSYKTLWAAQTGELSEEKPQEVVDFGEKVLGFHFKLVDMSDDGRILFTHFVPIASEQNLKKSFLYRCYTALDELPFLQAELENTAALSMDENGVIINKRMEIFKNYLIRNLPAYESMYETLGTTDNANILSHYDKIYKVFDEEERDDVKGEIYYVMAAHLMNGWFEEGLTDFMVKNGYLIQDKLESIYSRYLLSYKYDTDMVSPNIFLSPLLLKDWGANIKNFYNVDKVIYFIGLEKETPADEFITPDRMASSQVAIELSQFYPILSYELQWLLFSVLDVNTGDYTLNRNYDLEKEAE